MKVILGSNLALFECQSPSLVRPLNHLPFLKDLIMVVLGSGSGHCEQVLLRLQPERILEVLGDSR